MARLFSEPLGRELTEDEPAMRASSPVLPLPKTELFPWGPTPGIRRPDSESSLSLSVTSRKCLT